MLQAIDLSGSQVCLEMLYFANYSGDSDSSIVRETWARLIDQAISCGGIAEACSVLKRVGSHMYPGDGAVLPLDTLCIHLEKAALVSVLDYLYSLNLVTYVFHVLPLYRTTYIWTLLGGLMELILFCSLFVIVLLCTGEIEFRS